MSYRRLSLSSLLLVPGRRVQVHVPCLVPRSHELLCCSHIDEERVATRAAVRIIVVAVVRAAYARSLSSMCEQHTIAVRGMERVLALATLAQAAMRTLTLWASPKLNDHHVSSAAVNWPNGVEFVRNECSQVALLERVFQKATIRLQRLEITANKICCC